MLARGACVLCSLRPPTGSNPGLAGPGTARPTPTCCQRHGEVTEGEGKRSHGPPAPQVAVGEVGLGKELLHPLQRRAAVLQGCHDGGRGGLCAGARGGAALRRARCGGSWRWGARLAARHPRFQRRPPAAARGSSPGCLAVSRGCPGKGPGPPSPAEVSSGDRASTGP